MKILVNKQSRQNVISDLIRFGARVSERQHNDNNKVILSVDYFTTVKGDKIDDIDELFKILVYWGSNYKSIEIVGEYKGREEQFIDIN